MSVLKIGKVLSGLSHRFYEVFWNKSSMEIYVDNNGRIYIGKASSALEAMNIAEVWLNDK